MSDYISIGKRIKCNDVNTEFKPYPNIDVKYGPYNSVESANNAIPQLERSIGLTVGIINNFIITEYWYSGGINNEHLVKKIPEQSNNGGGDTTIINNLPIKKASNLTLTIAELNRLYGEDTSPIIIDDTTNNKLIIKTDQNRYYILDAVKVGETPPENVRIVAANVISMK